MAEKRTIKDLIEDEWYHVRFSGEIPEVALHSSIHFLTEDSEGPRIELDVDNLNYLEGAVIARYREIIFRDINPENKKKSIYRGVLRAIANWRRLKRFCHRHGLNYSGIKTEVAQQFLIFLEKEIAEIAENPEATSINCSFVDLDSFAGELGVCLKALQEKLKPICLNIS